MVSQPYCALVSKLIHKACGLTPAQASRPLESSSDSHHAVSSPSSAGLNIGHIHPSEFYASAQKENVPAFAPEQELAPQEVSR